MYLVCEDSSIDEGIRTVVVGPFPADADARTFADALERVAETWDFRPVATCRDYRDMDGDEAGVSPFDVLPRRPRSVERQAELEAVAVLLEGMGFARPEGFNLDVRKVRQDDLALRVWGAKVEALKPSFFGVVSMDVAPQPNLNQPESQEGR